MEWRRQMEKRTGIDEKKNKWIGEKRGPPELQLQQDEVMNLKRYIYEK